MRIPIKKLYKCITIDPPWNERGGGRIKRGAQKHYDLLKSDEIAPVVLRSGVFNPATNAHLYLWVTNNHLKDGIILLDALGFRYVTNLCWTKTVSGIGQYFRGRHELLLFGVRGSGFDVRTARRDIPSSLILDHVRENGKRVHSAKPQEFYDLMMERTDGPYLEMFARGKRRGWDVWGDEV